MLKEEAENDEDEGNGVLLCSSSFGACGEERDEITVRRSPPSPSQQWLAKRYSRHSMMKARVGGVVCTANAARKRGCMLRNARRVVVICVCFELGWAIRG